MIKLKHNDKVILEGKRGRVFTVRGYAESYNEDPETAYNRAIRKGHNLYCINQESSILCGDPEFWGRINSEWGEAIQLNDGELVEIEDKILKVRYKGNYSDMGAFFYYNHVSGVNEFNVGDTIYYMDNNEVRCASIVSKMKVENDPKYQGFTTFGEAGIYYATVDGIIKGRKAFAAKQELLDSL